MNRRPLYIGLLVLGAALLLVGGFLATFQRKDVTEPTPAHGEARYNPFFALELTLNRLQLPTRSLATLDPAQLRLKPGDTLLLGAGAARVERAERLLMAFSYREVLKRGFALVRDGEGRPLRAAADVSTGIRLDIEFADGRVGAIADGEARPTPTPVPRAKARQRGGEGGQGGGQGSLFG